MDDEEEKKTTTDELSHEDQELKETFTLTFESHGVQVKVSNFDSLKHSPFFTQIYKAAFDDYRDVFKKTGRLEQPTPQELLDDKITPQLLNWILAFLARFDLDAKQNVEYVKISLPVTSTDMEVVFPIKWMRDFITLIPTDAQSMTAAILAVEYCHVVELSDLLFARQATIINPMGVMEMRRYYNMQPKDKRKGVCNCAAYGADHWCDKCAIFLTEDEQEAVRVANSWLTD